MTEKTSNQPQQPQMDISPNDVAGFNLSSTVKITDPNTGEVLLHQRAD